ncbi:MAG TPA: ABC transporter ATP-binding protein [Rhodothermales bacterium]|nr:ABC transporter ATP-binding protein [Rhodothermales bacterium]
MNKPKYTTLSVLKRLIKEARGYRVHLLAILGLSFLGTPVALLNPIPLKIVVDNVIGSDPLPGYVAVFLPDVATRSSMSLLIAASILMIGLALFNRLRGLGTQYLRAYTAQNMVLAFRARLFAHAQRLSIAYHDRAGSMDSTYRILYDAASINQVLLGAGLPLLRTWFPLIGMVVVMSLLDLELTLIALLVVPVLVILVKVYGWRLKTKWRTVKDLDSAASSVVQESLSTLRVVKAFQREKAEESRFLAESSERVKGHLDAVLTGGTYHALVGISITAATAAVLFVGTLHVQSGILTLGELLMIMAYVGQIFGPLSSMTEAAAGLANGLASAERALQLLDERPEVVDKPDARRLKRAIGAVEFKNVSFSYVKDAPVLNDVSFTVEPGERVAIRGKTGAGKSTLVSLLMRFYDVESGRITVDGRDIRDYRLEDYRDQFAIVLQEPVLFSTTIAENITYGRDGATLEEIVEAAKLANAHDFISRLDAGYETQVGERGAMLSGGERQRVACARAFLKDAPILILDEPTSSIDVATESEILEAFDRLQRGRTTFVISHRASTLEGASKVLDVEGGTVTSVRVDAIAATTSVNANGGLHRPGE